MVSRFVGMLTLAAAVTLAGAGSGWADTYYWMGGSSGNSWNDPNNWIPDAEAAVRAPTAGDTVVFDNTCVNPADLATIMDIPGIGAPGIIIKVVDPAGPVTINIDAPVPLFTLASGLGVTSIDMTAATQNLTITSAGPEVTLNGAALFDVVGGSTLNIACNIFSSTMVSVQNGGNVNLSGVIDGPGGVTMSGAGVMTLSGINTYTGATAVNNGLLQVSGGAAISNNAPVTVNGGTLGFSDSEAIGTLGGVGGSIDIGANTLTIAQGAEATYSGNVTGLGGSLVKQGASRLILSGANTYTGLTTISQGPLRVTNAGALGAADAGTSVNGGSLELQGGITVLAEALTLTGDAGALIEFDNFAGNNTWGGSITLAGQPVNIRSIGGALTLSGAISGQSVIFDGAGSINANGVIGPGAISLTKNGVGTLTLSGANTYTGDTIINAGRIITGAADRIADASAVVLAALTTLTLGGDEIIGDLSGAGGAFDTNGHTLTVTQTHALTFGGGITGLGGIIKQGDAILTLSGSSGYAGATIISAGGLTTTAANVIPDGSAVTVNAPLVLGGAETIGALTGNSTITLNGGNLTINQAASTVFSGAIGGAFGLTKSGGGVLTLSGNNTYTGTLTVGSGALALGSATAFGTGAGGIAINFAATLLIDAAIDAAAWTPEITLNGNAAIQVNTAGTTIDTNIITGANSLGIYGSQNLTISGVIGGGAGGLNITMTTAANLVTLTAANTYTGATTVNRGTLNIRNAAALGTTDNGTTVSAGASLQLQGGIAVGNEALTLNSGAAIELENVSGNNSWGGAITLFGAAGPDIVSTDGTLTLGSAGGGARVNFGGAGNIVVTGVIGPGATTVTKSGTGVLTLSGNNTYTGATIINAGSLTTTAADVLPDGSAVTVNAPLVLAGAETIGALTGNSTITLNGGDLTVSQAASTVFSGAIGGAFGFTKNGAGTLELSGNNTYTGATTVSAGTLRLGSAAAFGTGAGGLSLGNATLQIVAAIDNNAWTPAITLTGNATILVAAAGTAIDTNIANGANTLTITGNQNLAISGVIGNGAGGLTINMAGAANVVTLTGANTYTGATTITSGTLNLQNATAAGTTAGDVTVAAGASLQLQGGIAVGNEALTLNGGAAIELENVSGNNSWGGAILLAGAGADIVSTLGTLTLGSTIGGSDVTFGGAGDIVVSDAVGPGATALTKSGAGVLTLNGANSYTGATTINGAGVVTFNGVGVGASPITVNGGTLAGTGTIPGAVTMNAGTILAPGGNNGADAGTLTIDGAVVFNNDSKYVVTMNAGNNIDELHVNSDLTAGGGPTIEFQAGYDPAGIGLPRTVIAVTGAYAAFTPSVPAGYTFAKAGNFVQINGTPAAMVPTLSEWGVMLTLLLLAGAGVTFMRRQRGTVNIAA